MSAEIICHAILDQRIHVVVGEVRLSDRAIIRIQTVLGSPPPRVAESIVRASPKNHAIGLVTGASTVTFRHDPRPRGRILEPSDQEEGCLGPS